MAELKRTLGYPAIIALLITSLFGTGIFFGPAIAARYSGNASLIAWGILGVMVIYISACFGELASMFPSAGGVYEFAKHAYGRFFSFIIGWIAWLVANITAGVLLIAAMEYIMPEASGVIKLSVAIFFIITLNYIAFRGVKASFAILIFFAVITVGSLLAIIIPGFSHINVNNYVPFFEFSPIYILLSLFFIIETFIGWESATFLAEETKNPEKTIPKALMITSIIIVVLGLSVAIVSLGVVPWKTLTQSPAPVNLISSLLFGETGMRVINISIFLVFLGAAASSIVSSPRLILALARDKLFIEQFADIHEKFKTPYKAIIFQTIITIIFLIIAYGRYKTILSLLVPLALIMYIFVLLSVPILRIKKREIERPFKVWFGKIGPVIVSLIYLVIIIAWLALEKGAVSQFRLILSFILLGVPIYLLLMFYYDPETIVKINSFFAYLSLWLENFLLPKRIRRDILSVFKDMEEKSILEYGSGVGTLTMHLAEAVGPRGKIYATDLSKRNIEILKKRMNKYGHTHVEVIHDEHQVNRIHPSIGLVDMIFSVGMLGYMQDVKKILMEMKKILPDHGKIFFVEYIDFFWILPNIKWLSNKETIEKLFRECGFSVRVEKKRGFLWNYIFVYGIKSRKEVPFI